MLEKSPVLEDLLNRMKAGDVLYVAKLDRLSRNYKNLMEYFERASGNGFGIICLDLPIGSGDSYEAIFFQKLMISVFGLMSEFETNRRRDRQMQGLFELKKLKKSNPDMYKKKYPGRKTVLSEEVLSEIKKLSDQGVSTKYIARSLKICVCTVLKGKKMFSDEKELKQKLLVEKLAKDLELYKKALISKQGEISNE